MIAFLNSQMQFVIFIISKHTLFFFLVLWKTSYKMTVYINIDRIAAIAGISLPHTFQKDRAAFEAEAAVSVQSQSVDTFVDGVMHK